MDGITKESIKTAKLIKQLWPQLTDKESFVIPSILMFLRKLKANISNHAVTLLLID